MKPPKINTIHPDLGEVTDIGATFRREIGKRLYGIVFGTLALALLTVAELYFRPDFFLGTRLGLFILILPWGLIFVWIAGIYERVRQAFWMQVAVKYGWHYRTYKDFSQEKALLFNPGHSRQILHGISGDYNGRPFNIFEYKYSTGQGKSKLDFILTVFEIKFQGTFPHLYLDCRNNSHSGSPTVSSLAEISLPREFEEKFRFYSPKEYEIETLQIFTPDIFMHLLEEGWKHDMEFVDGELVIYRKVRLNSFSELESELAMVKRFVDIMSPQLDRLKLTEIGDNPHRLSK